MKILPVAVLLCALAVPAAAHHSAAPHFDLEKTIVLDGVVTRFEFVNPHAYVYFNVRGTDGRGVEWRCELNARATLARLGWTQDIFPTGATITVKGAPARREAHVCMLNSFIRADGVEIQRGGDVRALRAMPPAAREASTSADRPARLASGQPNLQGPWVAQFGPGGRGRGAPGGGRPGGPPVPGGGRPGGPGGPGGPGRPQPSEAGMIAAKAYDQRFDDPAIRCSPANIIFGWTHDQHVNEIVQKGDQIILQYGYMDFVRTIHMNASHPRTITPTLGGHSTGRWDGDVLVVDTVGFAPGVLVPLSGVMHSSQMHVVERFTMDPVARRLTREFTVEDPLYLKAPYTGTGVMLLSDEPFVRYNCVELSGKNNLRP